MQVVMNSKFCESSIDNISLVVCATQFVFLIPLLCNATIVLILFSVGQYTNNEYKFAKGSYAVALKQLHMYEWQHIFEKSDF